MKKFCSHHTLVIITNELFVYTCTCSGNQSNIEKFLHSHSPHTSKGIILNEKGIFILVANIDGTEAGERIYVVCLGVGWEGCARRYCIVDRGITPLPNTASST